MVLTRPSLEAARERVAEASVDDTALTALRDELSERVAAVDVLRSSTAWHRCFHSRPR